MRGRMKARRAGCRILHGSPGRRALRRHWLVGTPLLLLFAALWGEAPGEIALLAGLGPVLLALLLYDYRYLILPDSLVGLVLALGLAGSLRTGAPVDLPDISLGVVCGGGALWAVRALHARLRGMTGLGLGDVKLFAAAGAWVGWQGLADLLLIACLATLGAAMLARWRGTGPVWRRARLPFGPGLAVALYVLVLQASG